MSSPFSRVVPRAVSRSATATIVVAVGLEGVGERVEQRGPAVAAERLERAGRGERGPAAARSTCAVVVSAATISTVGAGAGVDAGDVGHAGPSVSVSGERRR